MELQAWLLGVVVAGLELFLALALAVLATYSGMHILDALTRGIQEWKEIKKGNNAVGIVLLSIVISIAFVGESVVADTLQALQPNVGLVGLFILFVGGIVNLILATLLAIFAIYIAIRLFDNMTINIDEMAELKKGNVAMGLVLAGVILAITFMAKGAILQLIDAIGLSQWIISWVG